MFAFYCEFEIWYCVFETRKYVYGVEQRRTVQEILYEVLQLTCSRYKGCKRNEQYLYTLVDSRVGVNLDYPELKQIATIIKPLLDKGQTIYQILENHKE